MNLTDMGTATLARQQLELAAAIRDNATTSDTLLQATPQGSLARLHIYSHAYRSRLGEALKENYPVLARVLGDDDFAVLANAFLDAYPSHTPSIRWFGARLTEFIAQHPDLLPHPSLADLIRMEWALNTAFDAADADPLKVDALLALDPETWPTLRFEVHPSVRLLASDWNVEPLWTALTADENAETEPPEEFQHHLLIWRVAHRTQWRSVKPEEATLLQTIQEENDFTRLCAIAGTFAGDNASAIAAGYLRHWVESGLLAGYKVNY